MEINTETRGEIFKEKDLRFRIMDDENLFFDLIDIFTEEIPKELLLLEATLKNDDYDKIIRQSHKIKGSCASLGAEKMEAIAREIEDGALEGEDLESLRQRFVLCNLIYIELSEHLKGFKRPI